MASNGFTARAIDSIQTRTFGRIVRESLDLATDPSRSAPKRMFDRARRFSYDTMVSTDLFEYRSLETFVLNASGPLVLYFHAHPDLTRQYDYCLLAIIALEHHYRTRSSSSFEMPALESLRKSWIAYDKGPIIRGLGVPSAIVKAGKERLLVELIQALVRYACEHVGHSAMTEWTSIRRILDTWHRRDPTFINKALQLHNSMAAFVAAHNAPIRAPVLNSPATSSPTASPAPYRRRRRSHYN